MIHLYGIVDAPAGALLVGGLDGAPVETHVVDRVAAVVSRHPDGPAATREAIVRHAEVVEAALRAAGAVLPARFGAAYADEAELGLAVRERAGALADRLARVRGCVELGVRVLAPEDESPAAGGGSEYMRARLGQVAERRWIAAWAHGALNALARESTHRFPPSGRTVLVASYLVAQESQVAFERRVDELSRERAEISLVCTGPWPAYSFAEAT